MSGKRSEQLGRLGILVALTVSALWLGAVVSQAEATNVVHVATAANVRQNYTHIDNPLTNNNPTAQLLVTANLSPNGTPAVVNSHPIGVFYNTTVRQWSIFNQDMADMPIGAAFNVRVQDATASTPIQTAAAANIVSNWTVITNSITDGNTRAMVFATANWNPGGSGGTYDNHATGVWYDGKKWAIYNERVSPAPSTTFNSMPVGAAFNTELFSSAGDNVFLHLATASNTPTVAPAFKNPYTIIDDPRTNGNPMAILFIEHNWNALDGKPAYIVSPLAVNYLPAELKWAIVATDAGASIPAGAGFNVMVTGAP